MRRRVSVTRWTEAEGNATSCNSLRKDYVGSHGVEAAWAGGRNGREVMDRFFPLAPDLLSPRGLFYLVTIKENNPEEILKTMTTRGLQGTIALSRQAGQEILSVLRFTKSWFTVCALCCVLGWICIDNRYYIEYMYIWWIYRERS